MSQEGPTFHCATKKKDRGARSAPRPYFCSSTAECWTFLGRVGPSMFAFVPRGKIKMLHVLGQMLNRWHPRVKTMAVERNLKLGQGQVSPALREAAACLYG